MAPKSLVFAALLVAVVVSAVQMPRGAAGLGVSSSVNTSFVVSGIVPCATGTSINPATAPSFPNALVQLVCGGTVVASKTTDSTGAFLFSQSNSSTDLIVAVLRNLCKVIVVTPLGACDKSLAGATGTLSAPLKLLGVTTSSGSDLGGGVIGGIGGGVGGLVGGVVGGVVGLIGQIIGGILNLGTMAFSLV